MFPFFKVSRPALELTIPFSNGYQGIKLPEREADHCPPTSIENVGDVPLHGIVLN
jgi:hypothetical protein